MFLDSDLAKPMFSEREYKIQLTNISNNTKIFSRRNYNNMKNYTIQDVLNCLNTTYTDAELSYSDLLILAQSVMPIIDALQEKVEELAKFTPAYNSIYTKL